MADFAVMRIPKLNRPRLSAETMRELGEAAEFSVRTRIAFATDLGDGPAKPLDARYAQRKIRKGKKPVRDWRFSDVGMMASVDVVETAEEFAEIGFRSPFEEIKAFRFRAADALWGLSNSNRAAIQDKLTEMGPRLAREVVGRG